MKWISWMLKAITAAVAVVIAAGAAGTVDLEPWIEVALSALLAGIAVFLVPNGPLPTDNES